MMNHVPFVWRRDLGQGSLGSCIRTWQPAIGVILLDGGKHAPNLGCLMHGTLEV